MKGFYLRKIFALLDKSDNIAIFEDFLSGIEHTFPDIVHGEISPRTEILKLASDLVSASDRVSLHVDNSSNASPPTCCHPISGQKLHISPTSPGEEDFRATLNERWQYNFLNPEYTHLDPEDEFDERSKRLFWWFWRFFPERSGVPPLSPAHSLLPDTPIHSFNSAVSAMASTLDPTREDSAAVSRPHLVLFTFSPIQEFIKASRKFLDFWSGSYLLHYLSAFLCWQVAERYGPDAVITPSLWGQEIIDAFLLQKYPELTGEFRLNPVQQFNQGHSSSLSTAGFPNTISFIVPEQDVSSIGDDLSKALATEWSRMAKLAREDIKSSVIDYLASPHRFAKVEQAIKSEFAHQWSEGLARELEQYKQHSCWEWNALWEAQIEYSWESYYVSVPLGHPDHPLSINQAELSSWIEAQQELVQSRTELPTEAEQQSYADLNIGTWWGAYQARTGQLIQAVKNTRNWQIPVAPGERSSLSGSYSAVHPRLNYRKFKNGCGMKLSSMRLFWAVMGEVYPGLFNGSERLNAIELTKRLAWDRGGVAQMLGVTPADEPNDIPNEGEDELTDYERLIRFPNMSSIAMASIATEALGTAKIKHYWRVLADSIEDSSLLSGFKRRFRRLTRRPTQIKQVDAALSPRQDMQGYNGVMFSSKWLINDLNIASEPHQQELRNLVQNAHIQAGFGDNSPTDWWVLVLGDGDGMGKYVSGSKLKFYREYLSPPLAELKRTNPGIQETTLEQLYSKTKKRMGPGTHIGLNRALLDFSNRLVPYLAEDRCCGKVIYSGGDDVMAALPLGKLPLFLQSLRAAWSGKDDPLQEFEAEGGYWIPTQTVRHRFPDRPLFTMGDGATMSLGIVIAHKSVPLPTVLEKLWEAEKNRAKLLQGGKGVGDTLYPTKDGLCFRVLYGSGNTLEALMKGHLFSEWWEIVSPFLEKNTQDISPLLLRLAEELPLHTEVTGATPEHPHANLQLLHYAAEVVIEHRDAQIPAESKNAILSLLDHWEEWAWVTRQGEKERLIQNEDMTPTDAEREANSLLGTSTEDLANLLKFSAFWVSRNRIETAWLKEEDH